LFALHYEMRRPSDERCKPLIGSALAIDLLRHYVARILTVWLVKGKAVEDSQDARQEVLLAAYRVMGNALLNLFRAVRCGNRWRDQFTNN
jgi:hypothetical protein